MEKIFAGARLRHLRESDTMSQAELARVLEIRLAAGVREALLDGAVGLEVSTAELRDLAGTMSERQSASGFRFSRRSVSAPAASRGTPVHSTGLDFDAPAAAVPIGMLTIDENSSTFVSYPAVPVPGKET